MNPISESLTLIFRARELNRNDLLRLTRELLSLFDNSFLPKPKTIDPTGKKGFEIEIYSDLRIIKLVEIEAVGKQMPFTLDSDVSDFTVTITPSFREFVIGITLPQIIYTNISLKEIKELFLKICLLFNPDIGKCYPTKAYRMILDKYFEWEHRTSFFTFFCWLQYFSKKEFDRQGGEAIFQNPYIKAEKLGEGVLIQVGESPLDAYTPEGEELIVKATRALPPVVKN